MNRELEDTSNENYEDEKPTRQRYKSTKGDADKRKVTALANLAKGRAKKLENLKAAKDKKASKYK